jgi:glycine/D-amino acid oxidase-like deaminating enzyme
MRAHETEPTRRDRRCDETMKSLWLEEALKNEEHAPSLDGTVRCDVCVVGGGFTGLWTALRLKEYEPSLDVVLVEQDVCGSGASGRNGGFALTWWSKFPSLQKAVGAEEAVRLCRATEEVVDVLGDFCAEWAPAARYRKRGWLWTATSHAQVGAWKATVEAIRAAGGGSPFVELPHDEVVRRGESSALLAGVYEAVCASVQPAQLALGLRRAAIARGVTIFEHSKVTSWSPRVRSERGEVRPETVVVAIGAWLGLNNPNLAIISSDVVATERLDPALLEDGLCVSDSRLMVNYFREHDRRLVFGKGGGAVAFAGRADVFNGASPRRAWVEASLRSLYPELAGTRIERSWTGPIDRTKAGVPFFYRDGSVVYGSGYSAVGVTQTAIGGRILASLVLERDDEWASSGLARPPVGLFPPEPIRFLGAKVVRAAVARKERTEDDGRTPDAVSTWLASLAPPGFVPGARRTGGDSGARAAD